MSNQIKVLHVLSSKTYNGAENVVCQIVNLFREDGSFQMFYCSLDGPVRTALEEQHVNFLPIDKVSVSEIKRIIRKIKPDIIHAHDMRASFFASLACGNIPLISHIHNNAFDSRKIGVKSILYVYAALKAKHIFWVSQSSFNGYRFSGYFKKKSSILFNVIDIEQLENKASKDKSTYDYDVVYVGRLTYQKNSMRLVKVLEKVANINPLVKVAIIGDGDEASLVREYISSHNLQKNVEMLGFINNPYKIMLDSKCMIMTSLWEGTPMCALEAMALGLPIVSTPTDGLCELVTDSETGYLSDDDDELTRCVNNVVIDANLYNYMRENSLRKIRKMMNLNNYKSCIYQVYIDAKT